MFSLNVFSSVIKAYVLQKVLSGNQSQQLTLMFGKTYQFFKQF